ncbi:hypothetical protein UFOVP118_20 [uncultured Caudovirales phage]|uniref:Uncharacterized protein n=1 Tax=uncultured Caudovirales phage TaxID=2100421 RepID=A0A6J5L9B9_9CAUD|nr:hypothetical protein UFOVP118_20 [uncultured Caudovirales phage]
MKYIALLLASVTVNAYALQDESIGRIRFDDSTAFLYQDECDQNNTMRQMNYVDFAMNSHKGCWMASSNYVHLWFIDTNKTIHIDKKYVKGAVSWK